MGRQVKRDPIMTVFSLCDRMLRDDISKKWCAIGLYNSLMAESFPVGFHELWFFCRLADAPDTIDMKGSIVSPSGLVISMCNKRFEISVLPPEASPGLAKEWFEIGGRFKEIVFPEAGVYTVEMEVNGALLGTSSLHLVKAPE